MQFSKAMKRSLLIFDMHAEQPVMLQHTDWRLEVFIMLVLNLCWRNTVNTTFLYQFHTLVQVDFQFYGRAQLMLKSLIFHGSVRDNLWFHRNDREIMSTGCRIAAAPQRSGGTAKSRNWRLSRNNRPQPHPDSYLDQIPNPQFFKGSVRTSFPTQPTTCQVFPLFEHYLYFFV